MTRICRITVAAAGLLVGRLLAVLRRLWWVGVPAAAVVVSAGRCWPPLPPHPRFQGWARG